MSTEAPAPAAGSRERGHGLRQATLLLTRASHPRLALLTAAGLAVAAALSGRPARETGLVLVTVLVGQSVLGWHNDLADRRTDREAGREGKPLASGEVEARHAWFAMACGVLLVVPLALSNGLTAGSLYLLSLALGLAGNVVLRGSVASFLPRVAAYALYPAFLSYGGWGGQVMGSAPQPLLVVLAALLGLGVHVLASLPDLVGDHRVGRLHLPVRIALRTGAPRLLVLAGVGTALVLVGMVVAALAYGLRQ